MTTSLNPEQFANHSQGDNRPSSSTQVPAESQDWPWSSCPDCNRKPGELHTKMCGALD